MTIELPWIKAAKDLLGTQEISGPQSNKSIVQWAKDIGGWVGQYYRTDDIPWCGLFVGHIMQVAGLKPPPDMLAAIAWSKWGVRQDRPAYGSVVVFKWRSGRHHVGLAVGQDAKTIHTLGGNQSNAVNVTKFPVSAAISYRWPPCEIKAEPLQIVEKQIANSI